MITDVNVDKSEVLKQVGEFKSVFEVSSVRTTEGRGHAPLLSESGALAPAFGGQSFFDEFRDGQKYQM